MECSFSCCCCGAFATLPLPAATAEAALPLPAAAALPLPAAAGLATTPGRPGTCLGLTAVAATAEPAAGSASLAALPLLWAAAGGLPSTAGQGGHEDGGRQVATGGGATVRPQPARPVSTPGRPCRRPRLTNGEPGEAGVSAPLSCCVLAGRPARWLGVFLLQTTSPCRDSATAVLQCLFRVVHGSSLSTAVSGHPAWCPNSW